MRVYPVPAAPPGYETAAAAFGRLLDQLSGEALAGADHAAAERLVHREGTEVMRQLYESWLRRRAEAEPERDVEGWTRSAVPTIVRRLGRWRACSAR